MTALQLGVVVFEDFSIQLVGDYFVECRLDVEVDQVFVLCLGCVFVFCDF